MFGEYKGDSISEALKRKVGLEPTTAKNTFKVKAEDAKTEDEKKPEAQEDEPKNLDDISDDLARMVEELGEDKENEKK